MAKRRGRGRRKDGGFDASGVGMLCYAAVTLVVTMDMTVLRL